MIVTEKEAKEKWCPMARVGGGISSYNRSNGGALVAAAKCAGTECMLFEKVYKHEDKWYYHCALGDNHR